MREVQILSLGSLFAAGSGPSSWRSEGRLGGHLGWLCKEGQDFSMWRSGEALAVRVNGSGKMLSERKQRGVCLCQPPRHHSNFVLSEPSAPSSLNFHPSGICPPSLECFQLTQLSQVVDVFLELYIKPPPAPPTPRHKKKPPQKVEDSDHGKRSLTNSTCSGMSKRINE